MNFIYHRTRLGKTVQKISKEIGVSGTTIHGWENGRTAPRPGNVLKVAKAYDVPIEDLARWIVDRRAAGNKPGRKAKKTTKRKSAA